MVDLALRTHNAILHANVITYDHCSMLPIGCSAFVALAPVVAAHESRPPKCSPPRRQLTGCTVSTVGRRHFQSGRTALMSCGYLLHCITLLIRTLRRLSLIGC